MGWRDRHSVVPAVYCILRDGEKILLLLRANTGYMDGYYSLPSGHLEGNEPADVAACREAKEEIGVEILPEDLSLVHVSHNRAIEGDHERLNLFFEVRKWSGEPTNAEPDKCDEIKWVLIRDLPANIPEEVTFALENIAKNIPYSSLRF